GNRVRGLPYRQVGSALKLTEYPRNGLSIAPSQRVSREHCPRFDPGAAGAALFPSKLDGACPERFQRSCVFELHWSACLVDCSEIGSASLCEAALDEQR